MITIILVRFDALILKNEVWGDRACLKWQLSWVVKVIRRK
jgi:hypothetical protein